MPRPCSRAAFALAIAWSNCACCDVLRLSFAFASAMTCSICAPPKPAMRAAGAARPWTGAGTAGRGERGAGERQ